MEYFQTAKFFLGAIGVIPPLTPALSPLTGEGVADGRAKPLTNQVKWCFLSTVEMKNTFVTSMQTHAPVNGWVAICQRYSRPLGVVGVKF